MKKKKRQEGCRDLTGEKVHCSITATQLVMSRLTALEESERQGKGTANKEKSHSLLATGWEGPWVLPVVARRGKGVPLLRPSITVKKKQTARGCLVVAGRGGLPRTV